MKLTLVEVEAMLHKNPQVSLLIQGATTQQHKSLIQTVKHLMESYARLEVELTKIETVGPPEEPQAKS